MNDDITTETNIPKNIVLNNKMYSADDMKFSNFMMLSHSGKDKYSCFCAIIYQFWAITHPLRICRINSMIQYLHTENPISYWSTRQI